MSRVRRGECSDKFVLCCEEQPELLPASLNTRYRDVRLNVRDRVFRKFTVAFAKSDKKIILLV